MRQLRVGDIVRTTDEFKKHVKLTIIHKGIITEIHERGYPIGYLAVVNCLEYTLGEYSEGKYHNFTEHQINLGWLCLTDEEAQKEALEEL